MYDFHVHSVFSSDSEAKLSEILEAGIQKRLQGICITDHIDYQHSNEVYPFVFDPIPYFKTLTKMKREYQGRIRLFIGVELGIQDRVYEKSQALLDEHPFDFVLMSQHMVEGHDLYEKALYQDISFYEATLKYYETVQKNIIGFHDFDCIGHLDLLRRYHEGIRTFDMTLARDVIDGILDLIIQKNKGIEINAGGYRYGLEEPNPQWWIVSRYFEKNGRLITLGSDAHQAEGVGAHFDVLSHKLKEIGYREAMFFEGRKPFSYPL